jgi:hypothetical protein
MEPQLRHGRTEDGCTLKMMPVVDKYTRESAFP